MSAQDWVTSRLRLLVAIAIAACVPAAPAATPLRDFAVSRVPGVEPVLRFDFSLPDMEIAAGTDVTAGGKAVEAARVKFTPAASLAGERCAVLLLADNTPDMADYLPQVRQLLLRLADHAETAPFQVGLGVFADDIRVLVPIGGKVADLKSPDILRQIDGSGPSTEIYLSAQHAVGVLAQTKAARKILVIISNGRGEDKKYTHDETVAAARAARVRICTVGYAQPQGDNPSYLQTLTKLSEDTGGYKERANVLTRELPPGFEENLFKHALSGGRVEVNLAGVTAPAAVDFKVTTASRKEYVLSHKLDAVAAQLPPGKDMEKGPDKPPDKPPDKGPEKKPDAPGKPPAGPEKKPEKAPDEGPVKKPGGDPGKEPGKPDAEIPKDGKEPGKLPAASVEVVGGGPESPRAMVERLWEQVREQIRERPSLAVAVGGAALIMLLLIILAARRALKPPPRIEPAPVIAPQFVAEDLPPPPPSEEPPVLAWLESLDADQSRLPIRKTAVRLGRKDDNDFSFKNDSVSGHHAEIVQRGSEFLITNLAAANGVYVNGRKVESAELAHNDVVELGEVRFRFLRAGPPNPSS